MSREPDLAVALARLMVVALIGGLAVLTMAVIADSVGRSHCERSGGIVEHHYSRVGRVTVDRWECVQGGAR